MMNKTLAVNFTAQQLQLIDRLVAEKKLGSSRELVIKRLFNEHSRNPSGPVLASGQDLIQLKRPGYGKARYDLTLQPVSGKAVPVKRGEVLRISQVKGEQCVDFNAYNLHDYKERLDVGFTRRIHGLRPLEGDMIWTAAPRGRPMFLITKMPITLKTDTLGARCNAIYFELYLDFEWHTNCQDTFAECIREFGITPDDTHDSFNLWVNMVVDSERRAGAMWNPAKAGDYVDLLALFDTLAVPIICGSGDITEVSNYSLKPIRIQIFEKSKETLSIVDLLEDKLSSFKNQNRGKNMSSINIQMNRKLEADPRYTSDFQSYPLKTENVSIELSEKEVQAAQDLIKRGDYGSTVEEVIRTSVMRWWGLNRSAEGKDTPKIIFQD